MPFTSLSHTVQAFQMEVAELKQQLLQQQNQISRLAVEINRLNEKARIDEEQLVMEHNISLMGQLPMSVMDRARAYIFDDLSFEAFSDIIKLTRNWKDLREQATTTQQRARFQEIEPLWNPAWSAPIFVLSKMRVKHAHPNTISPSDKTPVDGAHLKKLARSIVPTQEWLDRQQRIIIHGRQPSAEELRVCIDGLVDFGIQVVQKLGRSDIM